MLRLLYVSALVVIGLLLMTPASQAQGTTSFTINVPVRPMGPGMDGLPNTDDDLLPISKMETKITLSTTGNVAFNITNPHGEMLRFPQMGTMTIGGAAVNRSYMAPAGAVLGDTVIVTPPPAGLAMDDPARFVYSINISTNSDYNPSTCADLTVAPENWTIAIDSATDKISGVCVMAFDKAFPLNQCLLSHLILAKGGGPLPTVNAFPAGSVQQCATARPGLDAILVLDKSGSMSSPAVGNTPPTKIESLRQAVQDFVSVWAGLRMTEASPPADRIGLVFFDSAVRWASQMGIAAWTGLSQGLDELDKMIGGMRVRDLIVNNIDLVPASGSTAMGGGIVAADGVFAAAGGNRKVMLLMSNGWQNVNPRVKPDNAANPTQVLTHNVGIPNPPPAVALPNQANYQIYSVTVGAGTAADPVINQNVAKATRGFYINSEDNAALVRPFFLELLQNFIRFNSYETVRLVSGSVGAGPFTTAFPVPTAARMVAVILQWQPRLGAMSLTVTPPGAQPQTQIGRTGLIVTRMNLPLTPVTNPNNPWQVEVRRVAVEGATATAPPIPVDVMVLSDDLAIHSEMTVTGDNFVPGQPIRLQARLTEFGEPVTNIPGSAGGQAVVQLVRPGVSIGDLLSDNQAAGTQPAGDPGTAANAKLIALLQQNPNLLQRVNDTITLADNGNAANGDETANDGVYSALFTPQEPGHYNYLFGVEGASISTARFSRQQLKSVYVRPLPVAANTQFETNVADNQLSILVTPRTLSNSQVGPGFANYIWFTAPNADPVKPVDNLDGTYRATLPATARPVSMHFLDVAEIILDDATADQLPGGLNDGNVIVPAVPGTETGINWLLVLLVLLVLLLLLAFFLWKRAHP